MTRTLVWAPSSLLHERRVPGTKHAPGPRPSGCAPTRAAGAPRTRAGKEPRRHCAGARPGRCPLAHAQRRLLPPVLSSTRKTFFSLIPSAAAWSFNRATSHSLQNLAPQSREPASTEVSLQRGAGLARRRPPLAVFPCYQNPQREAETSPSSGPGCAAAPAPRVPAARLRGDGGPRAPAADAQGLPELSVALRAAGRPHPPSAAPARRADGGGEGGLAQVFRGAVRARPVRQGAPGKGRPSLPTLEEAGRRGGRALSHRARGGRPGGGGGTRPPHDPRDLSARRWGRFPPTPHSDIWEQRT